MRYSQAFIKTTKETPRGADTISAALLARAGFIDQEMSGVYTLLPLGWRVAQKIISIVRAQMNLIGAQEIMMPTLQPKELWLESGRWDKIDPPLFKLKDRHGKELALGSTHEEVIVDLVRDRINSFRELPQMLYQIQNKFRNEQRSTGGLLRVREFLMKDAYSFHQNQEDLDDYYQKVIVAYRKIYSQAGLDVHLVEADSGTIGGEKSHEFMTLAETGEDRIFLCGACDWAVNLELVKDIKKCPDCGNKVNVYSSIEVGHIFMLGGLYAKKMKAEFLDSKGKKQPFIMGCYGIGIGRLIGAIAQTHNDQQGLIWPREIAPYQIYLAELVKGKGEKIYQELTKSGVEVLYDDREISAGIKFAEADLLGIPIRVVISEKTLKEGKVEMKLRNEKAAKLVDLETIKKLSLSRN
ncbi:MAG: proline--tRNA ligase [Patescibacteria group bacterium]